MKKFFLYLVVVSFVFTSCEDDSNTIPFNVEDLDALIINYGSYNSTVGSITGFDMDASITYNNVFEAINGPSMSGKPQYVYNFNEKLYFMGNNLDEIFYLDNDKLKQSKNGTSTDIVKPRFCVGNGDYLYISCYGGEPWVDSSVGYIAKYNTVTEEVETKYEIPGGPEGMEIANGNIYIALNYARKIAVFNLTTENISYIETESVTSYFLKDDSDNLYVSLLSTYNDESTSTGLGYINTTNNEIESTFLLDNVSNNYSSIMSFNADKSKIYVLATSYDENYNLSGAVKVFDVDNKQFESSDFVSSISGLNAVSVNPDNDEVYVMISESTTTNGELQIYNENGEFVKSHLTGISPTWVLYR